MTKSTHRVEVVPVCLEPHPNAQALSIVHIWGYSVCVRTADWQDGALGAYIVPDSVVDTTRPEFAFLGDHPRIRVKRLRGTLSQGLLIPAPPGAQAGDDVAELLGVQRYEPPENACTGGDNEPSPVAWAPSYDVESWHRYKHLLRDGEPVVATEKVHGTSARYLYADGRMYCGSRTAWKKESDKSAWWKALRRHPEIATFCTANPECVLYGEVYGQVQDLRYGAGPGEVFFRGFDVWQRDRWLDWEEAQARAAVSLPWVPALYTGPYNGDQLVGLAEGGSVVAAALGEQNLREGIVVKPMRERTDLEIGRVQLKIVSNAYLERP